MSNFRPVVVDPHAAGPFAQLQDGDSLTIGDNEKLLMGDAQDSSIYYTGSNLVIDSREVGTGDINFRGIFKPLSTHTSFSLLDDDRIISTEPADGTNQIIDAFPTLTWTDSGTNPAPYFGAEIGIRDERTYAGGGLFSDTEGFNYGLRSAFARSSSFTGAINVYQASAHAGNFRDQGVYNESANTLKTITWNYNPWELNATLSPTINIGAGNNGTYNARAMEIDLTTSPTLNSGNLNFNVRGVSVTSTGTTVGTSVGYAFYADLTGYDTSWAFYNATASPNFLGLDNSKTYWGTGQDASIAYDGTNLVIDSQEVGSGDLLLNPSGGSVGVNTSSPAVGFHADTNAIRVSGTNPYIETFIDASTGANLRTGAAGTTFFGFIGGDFSIRNTLGGGTTDDIFRIKVGASDELMILNTTNVTINAGTTGICNLVLNSDLGNDVRILAQENGSTKWVAGYDQSDSGKFKVSQTAFGQEFSINTSGFVGINSPTSGGRLHVTSGATGTITFIAQAFAAQTANLTEWQDSAGTPLTFIEADGEIVIDQDSKAIKFGADQDATILYDGTNLVIDPKAVGSGVVSVSGEAHASKFVAQSTAATPTSIFDGKDSSGTTVFRIIVDPDADENLFMGQCSPASGLTGTNNLFINVSNDESVGDSITTGNQNVFLGSECGRDLTTGANNVGIGHFAARLLTTGIGNICIGALAGDAILDGFSNMCVGTSSGSAITSGSNNAFVGVQSGRDMTDGVQNVGVGTNALLSANADFCVAVGTAALDSCTGDNNTGIGQDAGGSITSGTGNTFLGAQAGNNANQLATAVDSMALGTDSFTTASNQVVLGGPAVTDTRLRGDVSISNQTEGNVGRLTYRTAQQAVTLSGASTDSTINIPAGAVLLGVSFNVNTAVTDDGGDDTWSAAFTGGSSTSLASGAAAAQNTKVDTLVVPEVASAQTNVRFTPNGGNFTAGVIEIVAYYYNLTSLDDV